MLIFFALTGAAQMIGFRLGALTAIHTRGYGFLPFRIMAVLMALSIVVTAIIGIVMALRFIEDRKLIRLFLAGGVLLPIILLILANLIDIH
jgi:hypothetical protein